MRQGRSIEWPCFHFIHHVIEEITVMENVIEEISKIDKNAFAQEEHNIAILKKIAKDCDDEMRTYRDTQLKEARLRAQQLKEDQINKALETAAIQETQTQRAAEKLKAHFLGIESSVIDTIMNRLFFSDALE